MSFIFENCLTLNISAPVKDDATAATETTQETVDPVVQSAKATMIQSRVRGMIVRKRTKNKERLAMDCKRSRAGHTLMGSKGTSPFSVEQNIRSIKQTLAFNDKVWSRCKSHIRGEEGTKETKFARAGFTHVQVNASNKEVTFSTKAGQVEKLFDTATLASLPGKLTGIFEIKYDENCFVNCSSLLERAQLLHEDVLNPFLVTLKEHVEAVKMCLQVIDTWLEESAIHLQFLTRTFDVERTLEIPDNKLLSTQASTEVLKQTTLSHDFQIKGTFDITKEDERLVLKKMLEFVSS